MNEPVVKYKLNTGFPLHIRKIETENRLKYDKLEFNKTKDDYKSEVGFQKKSNSHSPTYEIANKL